MRASAFVFGWLLLLCGATFGAAAQATGSGHYGEALRLAFGEDADGPLLGGYYQQRSDGRDCRFLLHGRPLPGGDWKLLLAAGEDRLLGRLQSDQGSWRLQLPRSPRGCEHDYQQLTGAPRLTLTTPTAWTQIRVVAAERAHFHASPSLASRRRAYVIAGDAVAVHAQQGAFVDAQYLASDLATRGWLDAADLAPLRFDAAGERRWRQPLPGLSAPAQASERNQWRAWLDWSDDCESRFQAQHGGGEGGLTLLNFGASGSLLRISCGALAYQESFAYAWLPPGRLESSRLLQLPGFDPDLGEERLSSAHSVVYGIDEFDRARGELRIFSKYRGAGDCGQWLRFQLAAEGLRLLQWRERDCDAPLPEDEELPPPQQWPLRDDAPAP